MSRVLRVDDDGLTLAPELQAKWPHRRERGGIHGRQGPRGVRTGSRFDAWKALLQSTGP